MTIAKARTILNDAWNEISDEKLEKFILLYRSIARTFINKHVEKALEWSAN